MGMRSTNWKDIVEFVGIGAIIASLVFVGMQMQQSQQLAFADSVLAMAANRIEEGSLQAEHIDVWLKGNAGEEMDAKDREVYKILFANKQDAAFYNWIALENIGTQYQGVATQGLARFLYQNPGARVEWNLRTQQDGTLSIKLEGVGPAFATEVNAVLEQFEMKFDND